MERRRYFFILASLIGILLSSCASQQQNHADVQNKGRTLPPQSSSAAPAETGAANEEQDKRPVIVTFGDSLTAGVVEHPYPEYLQQLLDKNSFPYRVDNEGVSGDTTTDGLARIDNVVDAHPALVILEFGGNDGLRGIPVESTQQNLAQMIDRLQSARIPVVLLGITLPPNYGPDYVKGFDAIFPALAKQYHLRFLPFLLVHVYQHSDWMQPDGIHPNAEGNRIVANDVFALIEPLLKRGVEAKK